MPSDFYTNELARLDRQRMADEERRRYEEGANMRLLQQLAKDRQAGRDYKLKMAGVVGEAAGRLGKDVPQFGPEQALEQQTANIAQLGAQATMEAERQKAMAEKQKALAVEKQRLEKERLRGTTRRDVEKIRGGFGLEKTEKQEEGRTGRTRMTTESRERIAGMNIASALERQARDQLFQWEDRQDAETFKYNLEMELADKQMQRLMQSFRNNKKLAALRGKSDAVNNVMRSMTAVVGKGMGSLRMQGVNEAKRLLPILKGTQAVYLRAGGDMNPEKAAQAVFEYLETTDYAKGIGGGDVIDPELEAALNAPTPPGGIEIPGWEGMDQDTRLGALQQAGVIGEE